MNEVVNYLKEKHYEVKFDEPLSKYTTFKVGGIAAAVVFPLTKSEITELVQYLNLKKYRYRVFGNGSNILPSDNYYDGVIIKTNKALNYLKVEDDVVTVGSGYSCVKLAYEMANFDLAGLEFMGAIPGSMGGALYMNAGAYNREIKDVVLDVTLVNNYGKIVTLTNKDLQYSYRTSILQDWDDFLLLETRLKLEKGNKEEILALLDKRKEKRNESQPLNYPSAGSTFRNPNNCHAWELVESAGLRGYSIGGAKVSEKHCNFIVNYNKASSNDIKALVDYVIMTVFDKTNVRLKPEIEFFNW
ncbi:MAG: UDP-N-acetylenolpyruvoylglucosamine reductase [Haloplasmataceae bacterium]|jgi:UDP-N-acetylmuramate dehydrogenase|nr:UDP-N-acetylenolpyruvoylglucosamine reductase [Haloplasmataceae bacterium]